MCMSNRCPSKHQRAVPRPANALSTCSYTLADQRSQKAGIDRLSHDDTCGLAPLVPSAPPRPRPSCWWRYCWSRSCRHRPPSSRRPLPVAAAAASLRIRRRHRRQSWTSRASTCTRVSRSVGHVLCAALAATTGVCFPSDRPVDAFTSILQTTGPV